MAVTGHQRVSTYLYNILYIRSVDFVDYAEMAKDGRPLQSVAKSSSFSW
jgi:hypothetical protein